jgi:aminopeptidase N
VLDHPLSDADRAHLLAHDSDPFNRWEAGRTLARQSLLAMVREGAAPDRAYLDGIHAVVTDDSLDPATRALMLGLPSQSDLARALEEAGTVPDPAAIYSASEAMREALADRFERDAPEIYEANRVTEAYAPDAEQSGKRSLANAMLSLITRRDGGDLAARQYAAADNMTQQLAALANLIRAERGAEAVKSFEAQWRGDRLVMDKWFGLQVMEAKPEAVAETVQRLTDHADFNWKNPNRFRAVFGTLAAHHAGFHHESGAAYRLLADWLIKLDPLNPQTTARMCAAFQTWKRYDSARQEMIAVELDRVLAQPELSRDTTEMLTRIRGA